MSAEEGERFELHERARETLGEDAANTLMRQLAPFDWTQLTTKADLAASEDRLRAEMAELRTALRGEMTELRGELAGQGGEMTELRGELAGQGGEVAELRGELARMEGRLRADVARQTRTVVFSMLGVFVAQFAATAALVLGG